MAIRLYNTTLNISKDEHFLKSKVAKTLSISPQDIKYIQIIRKSLDARKKFGPRWIYTVDVIFYNPQAEDDIKSNARLKEIISDVPVSPQLEIHPGNIPLANPPVVVGAGPAGLFSAFLLALHGFKPLVIERGQSIDARETIVKRFFKDRIFDPETNLLFGEGGAGAYSDGKLTSRSKSIWNRFVLEKLVLAGAPTDVLYLARPHLGSDKLPAIVKNLRVMTEALGGKFHFANTLKNISIESGKVRSIETTSSRYDTDILVLATGHHAFDTLNLYASAGIQMIPRPFQMGLRIEHPADLINHAQYGKYYGSPHLPTAEYFLVFPYEEGYKGVHTFCMCPGGEVIPAPSAPGELVTNGMSNYARDGRYSNSAVVVTIHPEEIKAARWSSGLIYRHQFEKQAYELTGNFDAPLQRVSDFFKGRPTPGKVETSYPFDVVPVNWNDVLPAIITKSLKRGLAYFEDLIPGFAGVQATLLGPETRVTSPIQITRDTSTRQSLSCEGIYPVGEGSGYSSGIMSSIIDGLTTAKVIIETYRPFA